MINETLKGIGLNKTEISIYLTLLSIGSAPASVAGKRSKTSRTNARYACHQLEKKGLLTVQKKKNTLFFSAEPLEKISYLLNQERRELDRKEEMAKNAIDQLRAMMNPDIVMEKSVKFYDGIEGVKRVYEDTLIDQQMIYAFEDTNKIAPEIIDYILSDYVPRRVKKNIFAQVLTPNNDMNKKYRSQDQDCLRKTKFFSPELFPVETEINIYGKKVAFFSYNEHHMFGAIIESSTIANTLKAIFSFCWKHSK